ncbi:unnamed protein product [Microthlaspi erraticum]|uniref:Uncharacterized protein n=1 Tax=Microthlaspi erraticum TaxID=1685480 RepID=A0A6D2HJI8_9BRAS|nr:unnamed protein product [Microthlaspi erraticum]
MHLPEDDERMWRAPPGWFIAYKFWFKESHMFFPLPKLFVAYCEDVRIAFSQLCPAGVRNITGTLVLAAELGMELNLDFYESMSSIAVNQALPGPVCQYKAEVWDDNWRYRNEWSPIFGRELGQAFRMPYSASFLANPPVNFYEDVRRLSEHGKRKWEDIAETRIKAQWLASRQVNIYVVCSCRSVSVMLICLVLSASWRLKKQKPMGKLSLNLPRYRQEVPTR